MSRSISRGMNVSAAIRNSNLVREELLLEGWPQAIAARLAQTIAEETARGTIDMVAAAGTEAAAARRRVSVARITGGLAHFQDWADRVASLRRVTAGHAATRAVLEAVMLCDFSNALFEHDLNLCGFRFPGGVRFDGAKFKKDAIISGGRFLDEVSFERAEFSGEAAFETTIFVKTDFSGARFANAANFRKAEFDGPARFDRAEFAKGAWFRHARFSSVLSFRNVRLMADAAFGSCVFIGEAAFAGTDFADHAGFDYTEFRGPALFASCRFNHVMWFKNARFAVMPDFTQARIEGATHFDGVSWPASGNAVQGQIEDLRRRMSAG